MSDKTKIEWAEATWNPITGCTKVSAGCKNCYAERDWARLSANKSTRYYGRDFGNVQCHEDVLALPLRWTKPKRIFVNSMSDLFHPNVPDSFIDRVFAVMADSPQHTYQILTKRPARMLKFLGDTEARRRNIAGWLKGNHWRCIPQNAFLQLYPLPNTWLGVSVEDQAAADERIPLLLQTPAAVRWISAEPMLGPIDLACIDMRGTCASECCGQFRLNALTGEQYCHEDSGVFDSGARLNWVVAGGESGPRARPMHPDWVRSLRDQCAAAAVPFLLKQWGEWIDHDQPGVDMLGSDNSKLHLWPDRGCSVRLGKRAAGRLLDGKLHDEYPKTAGKA